MLILLPNINTMHGKSVAIEEEKLCWVYNRNLRIEVFFLRAQANGWKESACMYMLLFGHEGSVKAIRPMWLLCAQHLSVRIDGQVDERVSRWTRKYMIRKTQQTNANSKSLEFLIVWGTVTRANRRRWPSCLEANKLILHTLCRPPEPPSFWAISISQ